MRSEEPGKEDPYTERAEPEHRNADEAERQRSGRPADQGVIVGQPKLHDYRPGLGPIIEAALSATEWIIEMT